MSNVVIKTGNLTIEFTDEEYCNMSIEKAKEIINDLKKEIKYLDRNYDGTEKWAEDKIQELKCQIESMTDQFID